jgi:MFS family permease
MNALGAYRRLLTNGPVVRLLVGEFVSSIGDWLYLVALLIAVYEETADPVLLGIVGAARVLPYVLLSVPAGIAADRFDRRLLLLTTDVVRGSIMVAMAAVVLTDGPLLAIVALAILATCFSCFFGPTIGAYLPSLVRDEAELGPANSAWATLDNFAFVIGPAVAGILIATAGLAPAFILNALSFGVVGIVLLGLPSRLPGTDSAVASPGAPSTETAQAPAVGPPTVEASLLASAEPRETEAELTLRSVTRPVAGLALVDAVSGFVFGGLGVVTVLIATDRLGSGEAGTGYLNAAIGVGGIIGALASGALVLRPDLGRPLLLGGVIVAVGMIGLGWSETLVPALIAMAIAATGNLVTEVTSTTIFQRVVPDAIRGRAAGAMATVATLAYAAGGLFEPILVAQVGFLPVLAGGGIALALAIAVALVVVGPSLHRPVDPATETLRRVSALPLFAGVPPAAIEAVAGRLRRIDVAAGTVVIKEGEPAQNFYIIEDGQFAVDQAAAGGSATRLRVLGPDEVFGELGLLRMAPRSATVTAVDDGRLLALDGGDFLELVSAGPGLSARLLDPRRFAIPPAGIERAIERQAPAS